MPSACNLYPKFAYSNSSPILHRTAGLALSFVVFGAIATASGVVFQMGDRTSMTDDRPSIVAIHTSDRPAASIGPVVFPGETELPRGPNTMPAHAESAPLPGAILAASTVSPEPNADGTPDRPQQDSAAQPASAESAPQPGATFASSTVSPEPNADGALDSQRDSTAQPASAAPDPTATKPSRSSVASKKPRKSAQTQNRRRDRGYNAYAWRQPAYYWGGGGYGRNYWRTSWR